MELKAIVRSIHHYDGRPDDTPTESTFDNEEDESITKEQEDATFMGKPGRGKGLMVFLDAHADRISSGSVFDDFVGFPSL